MVITFTFEYSIDSEVHKTKNWMNEIKNLVITCGKIDHNAQWFIWIVNTCALTPQTGWRHLLVQYWRLRRNTWTFEIVANLFVVMPAYYLYVEMYVLDTNKLKLNPQGRGHKKIQKLQKLNICDWKLILMFF